MENLSKLLSSIADLISAFAWPTVFLIVVYLFRMELKETLRRISNSIEKIRKAEFPGIAFELEQVIAAEAESGVDKSGRITPRQVEAAARIKVKAQDISPREIVDELDALCIQYDSLRRIMPSSPERTRAMTRLLVQMRSLSQSAVEHLDVYKSSGSPGSRLAAVAIMQMVPQSADLNWLSDRFSSDQPFIFYHAALALQNVANLPLDTREKQELRDVVDKSLAKVNSFQGAPDRNTLEVLEALKESII